MIIRFYNNPTVLVITAIMMIMALIFHNMVQAWVASRYGDSTPRLQGYLRFDPQLHLAPTGVLFLFLLGFGWPRSVPVNSRNYRGRGRQEVLVWLSGPLAYLLVALVSYLLGVIFERSSSSELARAFFTAGNIAILHAVINLFPVYPLDGAKAALAWGNPDIRRLVQQIAQLGILGFILIFFVLSATGVTNAIMLFFGNLIRTLLGLIPGL